MRAEISTLKLSANDFQNRAKSEMAPVAGVANPGSASACGSAPRLTLPPATGSLPIQQNRSE